MTHSQDRHLVSCASVARFAPRSSAATTAFAARIAFAGVLSWSPLAAGADGRAAEPVDGAAVDNGTNPTRVSRTVQLKYEHFDLRGGFSSDSLKLWYTQPLGDGLSAVLKLPVTRVDVLGNSGAGLGDVSVQVGKIFGVTPAGGHVVQGEMIFDTATRPELGGNQNVFKGTYIHAIFLDNGAILAPSVVHNVGIWGMEGRPRVNLSTVDLYYVPKMADPRNLVTFDPNINYSWRTNDLFASLAVTAGRNLGPSPIGGTQFFLLKPAILVGGDRPSKWGLELTYRIIGF